MSEADLMRSIQVAASLKGWRLFRNNVGFCKHCKIRFGLCTGSSDLIGWKPGGQFVAREVKVGRARPTVDQALFIAKVIQDGGDAAVIRSVAEL